MTLSLRLSSVLAAVLVLSACTSVPTGPSILVLPGTGITFDQFRLDDADCRQYASAQIGGGTANAAATDSGVRSAVIGTAIGATAGALFGGHSSVGEGAGSGLLIGSMGQEPALVKVQGAPFSSVTTLDISNACMRKAIVSRYRDAWIIRGNLSGRAIMYLHWLRVALVAKLSAGVT